MRQLIRSVVFSVLVVLASSVGTHAAVAVKSYQGADYSYDYDSKHKMRTCDQESDSTPVKGVYERENGSRGDVKDADGNNGVCGSGYVGDGHWVERHKTCEYRPLWPDECGNWQAT